MAFLRAQGATEYLVLLAIVLIIALVSVALLGFFPGMASDSQMTQNKMYWSSASPIAIVESSAYYLTAGSYPIPYLRIRNSGMYPVRITKLIGSEAYASQIWVNSIGLVNISDYYLLAPGEEKYFASRAFVPSGCSMGTTCYVVFRQSGGYGSGSSTVSGATSLCSSTAPWGTIVMPGFGFEYIEYIENQQITKRQIGTAPLIIKCVDASATY